MLGKLMKHEFRATARRMLPLFLVVVLLSCFLRISTAVIDHSTRSLPTILHMLNALLWVLFVLLLIGCVVFAVVVMVNRFYKNLLTDEGYLMFTLPVSIHKLLWSKLLVSSVWFLAAFAVDALALGIVLFENVSFGSIPAFFQDVQEILKSQYGFDAVAFVLEFLALMFVSLLAACLDFYAPIAVGHSFANHKTLLSVVFFFVFNTVWQILGLFGMAGVLEFLTGRTIFPTDSTAADVLRFMHTGMLSGIASVAFMGAVMYVITWLMLKKRLNLQ